MSNMSYCRFQNTLAALKDCAAALEDKSATLSQEEVTARDEMLQLAATMLGEIGICINSYDVDGGIAEMLPQGYGRA
jgi:hypothetical protein